MVCDPTIRVRLIAWFISFISFFCFNSLSHADESTVPFTWDDIVRSWNRHAERIPAFSVEYTEEVFTHSDTREATSRKGHKSKYSSPFAPGDLTVTSETSLLADRLRWKLNTRGMVWSSELGQVVPLTSARAFDGQIRTGYEIWDGEASHKTRPGWVESRESGCLFTRQPQLIPWMIMLRPLELGCSVISPDQWQPEGVLEEYYINESEGALLRQEFKSNQGNGRIELLIDGQREFALRRYRSGNVQVEIEYKEYPEYGWFPDQYRSIEFGQQSGELCYRLNVQVKSIRFGLPVQDSEFRLTFPPGTVVRDTTTGGGTPRTYFVKSDGTGREITPREWSAGIQYALLEGSPPDGSVPGFRKPKNSGFLVVIFNVLALFAVLGFILFRLRRK